MKLGRKTVYAGMVDIPEGESGAFKVSHRLMAAGATISTGNMRTKLFGQPAQALTFKEPTRWHELSEDDGVWMTDLPIEQRQLDTLITRATGRVIVGGLGLGYVAVALAAKPRVTEIVVVEQSADVINLVWNATLAKIEANGRLGRGSGKLSQALTKYDRVKVVQADLFEYLKELQPWQGRVKPFSWGLFDIWQGDGETTFHETVVPLRRLAAETVGRVECWNEDIMRAQLLMGLRNRALMLKFADDDDAGWREMVDLAKFCEPTGSPYGDWAVPFWRWFREHRSFVSPETMEFVMMRYAASYGRPELGDGIPVLDSVTRLSDVAV